MSAWSSSGRFQREMKIRFNSASTSWVICYCNDQGFPLFSRTFSGILAIDRQLYGTASQQAVQLQASTTWQTTVDDLMTADAAAVTNAPGGRAEDNNEDDNDA